MFTYAAAACGAETVVSVEPDHWLVKILKRTKDSSQFRDADVRIVSAAIGDTVGVETFLIAGRGRASNALMAAGGRTEMGGERSREFCPTLTLDAIFKSQPAPDFLKIDVAGFENFVLIGAGEVLTHAKPLIYIEIGKEQFESCSATLSNCG